MSVTSNVAHELNDADERILDELAEGRNLPQNLANELDYSRQYVQNRLQMLKAADYVRNVGGGLYELVEDPREDVGVETGVDTDTLEDARDAYRDLLTARERVDQEAIDDALDDLAEALGVDDGS